MENTDNVVENIDKLIPVAYVRFLHAAPSTPAADIYVNGNLVAKNIKYKEFTEYFKAIPGIYNIKIYPTGQQTNPVLSARINIFANMIYTAAISGEPDSLDIELIKDLERTPNPNLAYIRFIHLSPDAPAVDIYIDDKLALADISFREVSNYLGLSSGDHSIKVKVAGTDKTVLEDPHAVLKAEDYYSVYIVGYATKKPPLQVLIPLEGTTYIKF